MIQLQEKQDELIDRYLHNQMTSEEETAFEAALRTDISLRSRARFIAQTIQALKQTDEQPLSIIPAPQHRMVAKAPLAKIKKQKGK